MGEEYFTGFDPAVSRIFNIPWEEKRFLISFMMAEPIIYIFATLGFTTKRRSQDLWPGFIHWTGHRRVHALYFSLIEPQLQLGNINSINSAIHGIEVTDMPNCYYKTSGHFISRACGPLYC